MPRIAERIGNASGAEVAQVILNDPRTVRLMSKAEAAVDDVRAILAPIRRLADRLTALENLTLPGLIGQGLVAWREATEEQE